MDIFTKPLQVGRLIAGLGPDELREMARKDERTTEFGSASYVTKIRNRSAKFTEIVGIEPTKSQVETILKVREYLKDKEVIYTERTMCQTPGHQIPLQALHPQNHTPEFLICGRTCSSRQQNSIVLSSQQLMSRNGRKERS